MASRAVLCVALVALVAVPSASALKCYQCGDAEGLDRMKTGGDNPALKDITLACKDFDPANPEAKFEKECPALAIPGAKPGCMKTSMGGIAVRMCMPIIPQEGCQEQGDAAMCYCEGDLCNGAGLATPGLLLLAPAALLAILRG